jgi:hypothetical protein
MWAFIEDLYKTSPRLLDPSLIFWPNASFVFTKECLQSCHALKKALFGSVRLYTTFLGGIKPPGWTVCRDVDRLSPQWTGSCMEKPAFTRVNLFDVRVIMANMRVPVLELLY